MTPANLNDSKRPWQEGVRPSWTRIHLVYFILAFCDLLAVGTGLWLSHRTQEDFQASIASMNGASFLYDRAAALQTSAADLTVASYKLRQGGDTEAVEVALQAAAGEFRALASEEGFIAALALKFGGEASGIAHEGPQAIAEYAALIRVPLEVMESYEAVEERIRDLGNEVVEAQEKAIAEFRANQTDAVAASLGTVARLTAEMQKTIAEQSRAADTHANSVVAVGSRSATKSHALQIAIGSFIVLMVGIIMAYAHKVGRILGDNYDEIAAAHAGAEESRRRIYAVNEDVVRLNGMLAENFHNLEAAQDEILKKGRMAQLGHLTATVAHELRNPLGAVRTSAFLLERKIKDKGYGLEPQIQRIKNGIVRCDDIITQLLDFSRSSVPVLEAVDFDDWLQKLVEDEVQKLPAAVEVKLIPGLGGTGVAIDGARLSRAVINLLSNASEAMVGKGDDPEKFTTPNPKIVIGTRLTHRGAEFSVHDNGPGIKPEDQRRILEPLFTTKSFGTGLGLPAVQRIIDQHGGGLEIASEPGQGATFTVWIPVTDSASSAA